MDALGRASQGSGKIRNPSNSRGTSGSGFQGQLGSGPPSRGVVANTSARPACLANRNWTRGLAGLTGQNRGGFYRCGASRQLSKWCYRRPGNAGRRSAQQGKTQRFSRGRGERQLGRPASRRIFAACNQRHDTCRPSSVVMHHSFLAGSGRGAWSGGRTGFFWERGTTFFDSFLDHAIRFIGVIPLLAIHLARGGTRRQDHREQRNDDYEE